MKQIEFIIVMNIRIDITIDGAKMIRIGKLFNRYIIVLILIYIYCKYKLNEMWNGYQFHTVELK